MLLKYGYYHAFCLDNNSTEKISARESCVLHAFLLRITKSRKTIWAEPESGFLINLANGP